MSAWKGASKDCSEKSFRRFRSVCENRGRFNPLLPPERSLARSQLHSKTDYSVVQEFIFLGTCAGLNYTYIIHY